MEFWARRALILCVSTLVLEIGSWAAEEQKADFHTDETRYPTIKILDFAVGRRCDPVNLRDDYNCPQTLSGGLTLSKPTELPIDLPAVLRLAGCDSLDVRLATVRLEEAEGHTLAAKMQFLPTLSPILENRWHHGRAQNTNGTFIDVDKQSSRLGGVAHAEWHFGETIFQVLAARRREQAQAANIDVNAAQSRYDAVADYFDLVLARTELAIAEQRLKQADETVKLIENLVAGGAVLKSEVKRAQAVRAEVKQRVATAREKARVASLKLTQILHIDPLVTLIPQQDSQTMIAMVRADLELPVLIADGLERRPELKESRAYWNALDKERRAAFIAPLVPTVIVDAFNGTFGRDQGKSAHSDEVTAGLEWKIGPGGIGDVSRIRISDAQLRQEGIRFAKIADRVASEIVESHTHVKTSEELVQLAKEEIEAADESLKLSNERLKGGAALTLEVIASEEALFAAKSRAANNISEYNKAGYALSIRIGGLREADCARCEK